MLNRCEFIGNITMDPELKMTPNGTEVTSLNVAINEKRTDNDGVKQERTEFVSFVAFKGKANILATYAKKGDKIYLAGKMQTRSWEAQDGTKRYKTEIIVEEIELLGTPQGQATNNTEAPKQYAKKPEPTRSPAEEISIEDIPF